MDSGRRMGAAELTGIRWLIGRMWLISLKIFTYSLNYIEILSYFIQMMKLLLKKNVAEATIALLSWHMQNIGVIWLPENDLHQNVYSITFVFLW